LLAAAFEVAGTPVPWRGLLLACAAGQLGARLVPLPGGLGGVEGGVLGALALTGTHPRTAMTAVIVYRVAGDWGPRAAAARAPPRPPRGPGPPSPGPPGPGPPAPPAPPRPLPPPAAPRPGLPRGRPRRARRHPRRRPRGSRPAHGRRHPPRAHAQHVPGRLP